VFPVHVVHFYERRVEGLVGVLRFMNPGIEAGATIVCIAKPDVLRFLERSLPAGHPRMLLDAEATLAAFDGGDGLDEDAFHATIGGVLDRAAAIGNGVYAYGEMVAILWDQARFDDAIHLENLWNQTGRTFRLLCAYPRDAIADNPHAVSAVCNAHTHIERLGRPSAGRSHRVSVRAPSSSQQE
jgi:hypothetical protein